MPISHPEVEALHAPDSSEVPTLPRLTPLPGHTPDVVDLTGAYDLVDARAELSWTASSDPELASYELRSTPGPDYAAEDESTVASIPPGGPLAYTSSAGFGQPGNAVSYKAYVRPHHRQRSRQRRRHRHPPAVNAGHRAGLSDNSNAPSPLISARACRPEMPGKTQPDRRIRHPENPCQSKEW